MAIDRAADRLALAQMLSPAFPIGGFAYSQGLEQAMVDGAVKDAQSLRDWIDAVLCHGAGRTDAILLAAAFRDGDAQRMDELALAYAPSAERAREMREQGQAFAATRSVMLGQAQPALSYAVGFGAACRDMRLDLTEVLAMWLQALAAQLISAAVRFLPLAASEGQKLLSDLAEPLIDLARDHASADLADLATACFGADLAAMRHETLEVRIFRT